ncbi:MAG: formylmethanofuran--tetrahydromethanopterin N-formyltransferase [Planctomycetes bacterium]|nr:formylmethanofuran--tetrahydromethanopterin N-formyltransferase [Planctomycetota bacterium]
MRAEIDDTYAEAFRSIYAEVLITARDRVWLDHAVNAATGNASSSILCDCEAGLDRYVSADETPDRRPGAIVQFHVPRFHKDRAARLERSLLVRVSQNVLTCPTTACFNMIETPPADAGGSPAGAGGWPGDTYFKLGRKIAFFGDGWQFRDERFGRKVWVIPILSGEFVLDRRFGYRDGLMGGNLWFMGSTTDAALLAAERAVRAVQDVPGVILPFPGGVASSGSKAGSKYKFSIASTYEAFCPTLRDKLGDKSKVPPGIVSIQEIIINGRDLATISQATQAAIAASVETPGLVRISAGNYGGRLGKSFIYLRPQSSDHKPDA